MDKEILETELNNLAESLREEKSLIRVVLSALDNEFDVVENIDVKNSLYLCDEKFEKIITDFENLIIELCKK